MILEISSRLWANHADPPTSYCSVIEVWLISLFRQLVEFCGERCAGSGCSGCLGISILTQGSASCRRDLLHAVPEPGAASFQLLLIAGIFSAAGSLSCRRAPDGQPALSIHIKHSLPRELCQRRILPMEEALPYSFNSFYSVPSVALSVFSCATLLVLGQGHMQKWMSLREVHPQVPPVAVKTCPFPCLMSPAHSSSDVPLWFHSWPLCPANAPVPMFSIPPSASSDGNSSWRLHIPLFIFFPSAPHKLSRCGCH